MTNSKLTTQGRFAIILKGNLLGCPRVLRNNYLPLWAKDIKKGREGFRYMGSEFKRLKRYNATWITVRALAFAASVFLLIAGVLLMMQKLRIAQVHALWYGLAAVAGLAVGVVVFVLLRKSDMRLAEKLDQDRQLRERVQTMVAYQGEDSAMLHLQREDTENRLKQVRTVGVRFYGVVLHAMMLALALTVFLVGMELPTQAVVEPTQPTEPPYVPSKWQISALEELIEHVEKSGMASDAKQTTLEQLRQVRQTMDQKVTAGAMRNRVITAAATVYEASDASNSNDDINAALRLMGHDIRKTLAYTACALELPKVDFDVAMDEMEGTLKKAVNLTQLGQISADILATLEKTEWTEEDALSAAVVQFARDLQRASNAFTVDKDIKQTYNSIGEAVHGLKTNGALAKEQQLATRTESLYVVDTLCDIFGISNSERPEDPDHPVSKDESQDDVQGPSDGGAGGGEMQYGSDDKVYDQQNNIYDNYGNLINDYYADLIADLVDGKISPEMAEILQKYFGILYKPVEEDESTNP